MKRKVKSFICESRGLVSKIVFGSNIHVIFPSTLGTLAKKDYSCFSLAQKLKSKESVLQYNLNFLDLRMIPQVGFVLLLQDTECLSLNIWY